VLLSGAPHPQLTPESIDSTAQTAAVREASTPSAGLSVENAAAFSLDIDGNGIAESQTDGKLLIHYLSGTLQVRLTAPGALGVGAQRATLETITAFLDSFRTLPNSPLDADGDGTLGMFTDGRIIYRYLHNVADSVLLSGSVLGQGATRMDAPSVRDFLNSFNPAIPRSYELGALTSYSTIQSIGIELPLVGDADHDAQAFVSYRALGSTTWKEAMPLLRVDANGINNFAGSLFFLNPGTTYEIRLDISDPDGGADSLTTQVTTRPEPTLPVGGRTFHVSPGTGGGTGTLADPFKGIAAAETVALPGDTFLLHAGNYGAQIELFKSGAPGNYIVWKAAGDGVVLMQGLNAYVSHIWIEGITSTDSIVGLFSGSNSQDVVVTRNTFLNNDEGIEVYGLSANWLISDNVIVGKKDVTSGHTDGYGVVFISQGGHVARHNRISNVGNGITSTVSNVDIHHNDLFNLSDDGIEPDGGGANVRIWNNRITNAANNGISFQPQGGAPWYLIGNQIINNQESPLKFRSTIRFVLVHNTFVNYDEVFDFPDQGLLDAFSRNNLFISATSGPIWQVADFINPPLPNQVSYKTDLDYDGFDWGTEPTPLGWLNTLYPDVPSFAAGTGFETHGIRVNRSTTFENFTITGPPPIVLPLQNLTLKAGSNAIDAGMPLPNINDGFVGAAPDLGLFEFGAPLLQFGPRDVVSLSEAGGSLLLPTTSASEVVLVLPEGTESLAMPAPADALTDAADALVGLDDVRRDPQFAWLTGQGVRIAVIDTGADLDHPFFGQDADQNGVADRIVYQFDFADGDGDANDRSGHGTHVTSLIASEHPGFLGVAPDADLIVLKVFGDNGSGSFGNLERALQWVVANADAYDIGVVNLSLGDSQNWSEETSLYGLGDELAAVESLGIIAVAAAGNNFFTFDSTLGVAYPAADPAVLAVGAVWSGNFGGPFRFASGAVDNTTGADRIASFSQRHPLLLDVFAPGARFTGAGLNGTTLLLQGTSQSTAYLSGVAALAQQLAQQQLGRTLTLTEFSDLLARTADMILDGDDENDNVTNSGAAYGRVNVLALVEEIAALPVSAVSESYVVTEDTHLVVPARGLLQNDIALDLNTLQAVLATGPFTYRPEANFAGSDSFTYRAFNGVDFSAPAAVGITIHAVNDPPEGSDRAVISNEDAVYTLQTLDFGFADPHDTPAHQLLAVRIVALPAAGLLSNNGVPVMAGQWLTAGEIASGTLTYTPPDDATGNPFARIEFQLQDNGGRVDGGVDVDPATRSFTINVAPVNDAPSFRKGPDVAVLEDSGAQVVAGWATEISRGGGPDEADQMLSFLITGNSNPALFSQGPDIGATGTLSFTPAPDANGSADITVILRDNGGGTDTSPAQTFRITVTPVNDSPTLAAADPPPILEDAGAQTVTGWASATLGPGNESAQAVQAYLVSDVSHPELFAAGPSITPDGTLRYTPADQANGTSTFRVKVQDNGGTSEGGADTSAPYTFTITIVPVNDAPVITSRPVAEAVVGRGSPFL
jgi:hypothetical protein